MSQAIVVRQAPTPPDGGDLARGTERGARGAERGARSAGILNSRVCMPEQIPTLPAYLQSLAP